MSLNFYADIDNFKVDSKGYDIMRDLNYDPAEFFKVR